MARGVEPTELRLVVRKRRNFISICTICSISLEISKLEAEEVMFLCVHVALHGRGLLCTV